MTGRHMLNLAQESAMTRGYKATLRLLLLLILTAVPPFAQAGGPIPAEAYGDAGTLTYTGFISGSISFHSSQCTYINHVLAMELPYRPRYPEHTPPQPPPPGPHLTISFSPPQVLLGLDSRQRTLTNTFLTINHPTGVTWAKHQGAWRVTFTNFEIWDLEGADLKKPRSIILNGTVTCLYEVDGREKPITPLP